MSIEGYTESNRGATSEKPGGTLIDEQARRVVETAAETPGMSERMAETAYSEITQELAEKHQTVTEKEMSELVIHRVGFYQVKMLMEAMDVADKINQGDTLASKINEVGGKVIMDAMSGKKEAKDKVAEQFSENEALAFFGKTVNESEERYIIDYYERVEAFAEAERPENLGTILARAQELIESLMRKAKQIARITGMSAEGFIDFLSRTVDKAQRFGVTSLSNEERSLLAQAATI